MKPFDVFMWRAPGWNAPHPAVIVSHPQRAANKDFVEVILCTTQRVNRAPERSEVLLDTEDGLDWETLCKCDLIYAVPRADLKRQKGRVTEQRQKQIVRTILAAHGWSEILARA
jgi:mRNA-degrading endonuclease toxin of MazEF toxin-antitoxin module